MGDPVTEVTKLSQETSGQVRCDKFGPVVVQVVIDLLKKVINLCKEQHVDFSHIPEFCSEVSNDWTTAILKSYENFYRSDCSKLSKLDKPGLKVTLLSSGIPENFVCFSTAIKNIVKTVDSATGANKLTCSIKEITQRINDKFLSERAIVAVEDKEQQFAKTCPSEISKLTGNQATVKTLLSSPIVGRKQSFQIKPQKQVFEMQRKLKGILERKKSSKMSPSNILTPQKDNSVINDEILVQNLHPTSPKPSIDQIFYKLGKARQKSVSHQNRNKKNSTILNVPLIVEDIGFGLMLDSIRKEHLVREGRIQKNIRSTRLSIAQDQQLASTPNQEFNSVNQSRIQAQSAIPGRRIRNQAKTEVDFAIKLSNNNNVTHQMDQEESHQQKSRNQFGQLPSEERMKTKEISPALNPAKIFDKISSQQSIKQMNTTESRSQKDIEIISSKRKIVKLPGEGNKVNKSNLSFHSVDSDTERLNQKKKQEKERIQKKRGELKEIFTKKLKHISIKYLPFKNGVRFNVLGLLNTPNDSSIYNITAMIGKDSQPIIINNIDWDHTNQRHFKFLIEEDFEFKDKSISNENSCIVFQVSKYSYSEKKVEQNFAFAVLPIFSSESGKLYIASGQFQLPLYEGQAPTKLFNAKHHPLRLIEKYQQEGKHRNMQDYTQLVARLTDLTSNDTSQTKWWPEVEASMYYVQHPDPTKVYKYVLHARHGIQTTLKELMGEDFLQKIGEAQSAFYQMSTLKKVVDTAVAHHAKVSMHID